MAVNSDLISVDNQDSIRSHGDDANENDRSVPVAQLSNLTLYVDSKTVLHVEIDPEIGRLRREINVTAAKKITEVLLTSVFPSKMEKDDGGFPLLFTPAEDVDDLEN